MIIKIINYFLTDRPTVAELSKEQVMAYRAVVQGNQITRGCSK